MTMNGSIARLAAGCRGRDKYSDELFTACAPRALLMDAGWRVSRCRRNQAPSKSNLAVAGAINGVPT
jgi:hypothetical protein